MHEWYISSDLPDYGKAKMQSLWLSELMCMWDILLLRTTKTTEPISWNEVSLDWSRSTMCSGVYGATVWCMLDAMMLNSWCQIADKKTYSVIGKL